MTKKELAAQAATEACSPEKTAHLGKPGYPFWNTESYQFLYAPAFQFQGIPGCNSYRFTAEDEKGKILTFEAKSASASLSPIWGGLSGGVVTLRVEALDEKGEPRYPVGARTFFKLEPFPADLPPASCSYLECALRAYDYAFELPSVQYWLEHGTPDPSYDLNVYATKIYGSVARGMLRYAKLRPERAEAAMRIAESAVGYLIRISEPAGRPLAYLPPTYYIDFRDNPETRENLTAGERLGTVMMIYPAGAGSLYLQMEEATGKPVYLEAAMRIAEFYRDHVLENGTWPIVLSRETGKAVSPNLCMPQRDIVPFLNAVAARTGEASWKQLADGAVAYVEREVLPRYDWEGQFEDSFLSVSYSNLSHDGADSLLKYYAATYPGDEARMEAAEDLMRFVEDQFVVWGRPAPWTSSGYPGDRWITPAGLEQYKWHVPINASTSDIMLDFLSLYRAGRGELYLAKARALADVMTRVQSEKGMIPTHWVNPETDYDEAWSWINCHLESAAALLELDSFLKEQGIREGTDPGGTPENMSCTHDSGRNGPNLNERARSMKKILSVLISVILLAGLCSCSGTASSAGVTHRQLSGEDELSNFGGSEFIVLQEFDDKGLFYSDNTYNSDYIVDRIRELETRYNCRITLTDRLGADYALMNAVERNAAAGKTVGDMAYVRGWNMGWFWAKAGILTPYAEVSDIIDYENESEKYGPTSLLEMSMFESRVYEVYPVALPEYIPRIVDVGLLVVNEDLIRENGLTDPRDEVEKGQWNWDTFERHMDEYSYGSDDEKVVAVHADREWFLASAILSNGVRFVQASENGPVSGISCPETLEALEWVARLVTTKRDSGISTKNFTDGPDPFYENRAMLSLIDTSAVVTSIASCGAFSEFGLVPFPCGPSGEYGKWAGQIRTAPGMCLFLTADNELENRAVLISELYEPFEEYPDLEAIAAGMLRTTLYDERDVELILGHYRTSQYFYWPVDGAAQGTSFWDMASSSVGSKSAAQILQTYAPRIEKVIEEYVIPNYDYVSKH